MIKQLPPSEVCTVSSQIPTPQAQRGLYGILVRGSLASSSEDGNNGKANSQLFTFSFYIATLIPDPEDHKMIISFDDHLWAAFWHGMATAPG